MRTRFLLAFGLALLLAAPASAWWWSSYSLTVVGGSGSGTYHSGDKITITATVPAGQSFAAWLSAGPAAWGTRPQDFADPNASTTTFTMPKHAETVQATYRLP